MVTQDELIDKAIKEASNNFYMPYGLVSDTAEKFATKAIKTYIKLKDMENVAKVNESDIEKVVQKEYTESKHDCGDIPQTLDEVDKWAKNQKVDIFGDIHTHPEIDDPIIKHLCNVYGASNWYEAFANKFNKELDEENKRILQRINNKEKELHR